jgi:hypothetical protein
MAQLSLPYQVILKGSGFEWIIMFEQLNPEGFAYGQMTLKMQTIHEEKTLGCVWFSSSYSDLTELADYFEHHVKRLISDPWYDSDVFVQYGLEFEVQALCGEVDANREGDFGVRIMLLAGQTPDESRVHVGVEASVDVAQCDAFVAKLREFFKAWSSRDVNL